MMKSHPDIGTNLGGRSLTNDVFSSTMGCLLIVRRCLSPHRLAIFSAGRWSVKMKRAIIVVCISTVFISSCSLFAPKTQTVSVACSESDALLQINNETFKGFGQADVERDKKVSIQCTKNGFYPAQKSIDYSMSGTGVADTIGIFFFLLPGIGLFSSGAWSLDETEMKVNMVKQGN